MKALPFITLCAILTTPPSFADINYFLQSNYALVSTDDPQGDVEDINDFSWQLKSTFDLDTRGARVYANFGSINVDFDSGVNQLGQDGEGYRLGFGYEHEFPITRQLDVWAGVGINYTEIDFSTRQTVDTEGFLVESFGDRNFSGVGLSIHLDTYLDLTEKFVLGVGGFADIPLEDGDLESFGIRFTIGTR